MVKKYETHVSISEPELVDWINEQDSFKPSLIFRDAVKRLKEDWEVRHAENPTILKKRLEDIKKILGKFTEFIDKKKLNDEWFKFNDNIAQKEVFAKKDIETIEIDKNKEKSNEKT